MQKRISAVCVATICTIGVAVSAQSDSMGQRAMDKKGMKDGSVTVMGCVAAGPEDGKFMLTNAMMKDGMMDKGMMHDDKARKDDTKHKPAGSSMSRGHMMMSYELVGGTDMKAHVGHKVEIMGTVSKADMDRMSKMHKMDKSHMEKGEMSDKGKHMSDKEKDEDMKPMKLNVKSMTMVASTCS